MLGWQNGSNPSGWRLSFTWLTLHIYSSCSSWQSWGSIRAESLAGDNSISSQAFIGPSDDGGYYLIGLKQACPRLLREVQMSTPNVVADTMTVAAEEHLQVGLLPAWYDVDDRQSLKRIYAELRITPDSIARFTRGALLQPSFQKVLAPLHGESIASYPVTNPMTTN